MPRYDFECLDCHKVEEILCCINDLDTVTVKQRCECGGELKQIITTAPAPDWFREHVNYDFDGTPKEVKSKAHLKELCKQYGVQARCLL